MTYYYYSRQIDSQMKKISIELLSILLSYATIALTIDPAGAVTNLPTRQASNLRAATTALNFQRDYQQEVLAAYFNAGYGYCDAQMLGAFWSISPADAKMTAGKGLLGYQGYLRNIPSKLARARQQYAGRNVCSYASDFSYEDAVALATYWKVPISTAKDSLRSKLESGNLRLAKSEVRAANRSSKKPKAPVSTDYRQEVLAAYFNAGYGYCDAQMLGAFWSISPADAKITAGKGLLGYQGYLRNIPSKLARARQQYAGRNVCSYASDFSYEDAVALAAYWKVPISVAKSSLTSKLESGNLRLAQSEVRAANRSNRR
jgi:hypothetical protein